jgi:hypothetical protein
MPVSLVKMARAIPEEGLPQIGGAGGAMTKLTHSESEDFPCQADPSLRHQGGRDRHRLGPTVSIQGD